MRSFYLGCISFILFLSACQADEKNNASDKKPTPTGEFIFRMQLLFNESENFMSFPIWFDDSIVRKHGIFCLSREIYHISINNADEGLEEDQDLREKRDYYFNRSGAVDSLKISYYFDDRSIGTVRYRYDSKPDRYGFTPKIGRVINIPGDEGMVQSEIPFHSFIQRWSTKKYISFKDSETGGKYHYMLNNKYHGPLSVDSIIRPGPDDVVFLGTPLYPLKRYSVTNTVHERNVHMYEYDNRQIKTITRTEYPFEVRRSMNYDLKGFCTGFIDSTFSEKIYLSRSKSEFTLNNEMLPTQLLRIKENHENKTSRVSIEKYSYEVYEK
jgi:hypothetical protein